MSARTARDASSAASLSWFTRLSRVLLFWIAFVLTRPFGATVGDVLTKSQAKGGLAFGTVGSSAVLASILMVLVVWATVKEKRAKDALPGAGCGRSRRRTSGFRA